MLYTSARESIDVSAQFQDLLAVNEDSTLEALATRDTSLSTPAIQLGKKVMIAIGLRASNADIYSDVTDRVRRWHRELLTAQLLSASSWAWLSSTNALAIRLLSERQPEILRAKIDPGTTEADELDEALTALEELIASIVQLSLRKVPMVCAWHGVFPSLRFPLETPRVINITEKAPSHIRLAQIAHLFRYIHPTRVTDWKTKLIWRFTNITCHHQAHAAVQGLDLDTVRAGVLLQHLLSKEMLLPLRWLFCYLPWSVLAQLFSDADESAMEILVKALACDEVHTKTWYNERWRRLVEEMTRTLQQHIELCQFELGLLTDLETPAIHSSHLRDVDTLRSTIAIHRRAAKNIAKVFGAVTADDGFTTSIMQTIKAYTAMTTLLNTDQPEKSLVTQILSETCFMGLDDDFEAYEALNEWAILTPADYLDVGLLPGLTLADLENGAKEPSQFFTKGVAYLKTLGIYEVKDLRDRGIFGRHMLKTYLQQQARKSESTHAL